MEQLVDVREHARGSGHLLGRLLQAALGPQPGPFRQLSQGKHASFSIDRAAAGQGQAAARECVSLRFPQQDHHGDIVLLICALGQALHSLQHLLLQRERRGAVPILQHLT